MSDLGSLSPCLLTPLAYYFNFMLQKEKLRMYFQRSKHLEINRKLEGAVIPAISFFPPLFLQEYYRLCHSKTAKKEA